MKYNFPKWRYLYPTNFSRSGTAWRCPLPNLGAPIPSYSSAPTFSNIQHYGQNLVTPECSMDASIMPMCDVPAVHISYCMHRATVTQDCTSDATEALTDQNNSISYDIQNNPISFCLI